MQLIFKFLSSTVNVIYINVNLNPCIHLCVIYVRNTTFVPYISRESQIAMVSLLYLYQIVHIHFGREYFRPNSLLFCSPKLYKRFGERVKGWGQDLYDKRTYPCQNTSLLALNICHLPLLFL